MRVWWAVALVGCSSASGSAGTTDAGLEELLPPVDANGYDAGTDSGDATAQPVPNPTWQCSVPVQSAAGTECLPRPGDGPCADHCEAGAVLYSCGSGTSPVNAGSCWVVDAGSIHLSGSDEMCCQTDTCQRFTVEDQNCGGSNPPHAWVCSASTMPSVSGCAFLSGGTYCCP